VYACMETGNHNQARTILTELRSRNEVLADSIRSDVLADYGVGM